MCGITGIIDFNQTFSDKTRKAIVRSMNHAIVHRGPDEVGFFHNENCSLAMRRLSIIDLAGGKQPIWNETREIGVFFNGEIYNYPELKQELEQKGHQFSTQSDTEVLVHLYEEHGEYFSQHLKGMFAFCLLDLKKQMFLLGRDRFGEKPLYYHFEEDLFTFSSEVKSLLQNPHIPRKLNREALPYYLRTSLVPEPLTLLENVKILPAGQLLKVTKKGIQSKPFFKIDYPINPSIKTEEAAKEWIFPRLETAIERQMISDVPIGAFLSGGIDSSTVVALMQEKSSRPIKTFTVRFEEQAYNESAIAQKVAEYCGTEHHELVVPNYDFSESLFWTIIDHVGLPFRDSSAIPSFLITKEISQHVKVALSGDGGDELFGGYSVFQWYQKVMQLRQIPKPLRELGKWSLEKAQDFPLTQNLVKIRQIHRGIKASLAEENNIPNELNAFFTETNIQNLLNEKLKQNLILLQDFPPEKKAWSDLRTIMYYRNRHTLPANMLVKIDRMSMANSLEVRAPFLDPDLFAAAASLPDEFLVKKGKGKYLIRELMKDKLPDEVFNHPKQGFNIPLHKYQNSAFKQLAEQLLFTKNPWPDFFDKTELKRIFDLGLNLKNDTAKHSVFQASHQLWMLMQLLGWAKRFGVQL